MAWTNAEVNKDLQTLVDMYKNETDPNKRKILLDFFNGFNRRYYPDKNKDKIDDTFEGMFKFRQIYPALEQFFDLANKTGFISRDYILHDDRPDIKLEEAYELLHEFFRSCGKEIFDYYSILEKQRDSCLNFSEDNCKFKGRIIPIPILEKAYIIVSLKKNRSIKEILNTLAHEYGHGAISLINSDRYYSETVFTEIESYFLQLIGLDYFYNATNDPFYLNQMHNLSLIGSVNAFIILSRKEAAEKTMFSSKDYSKTKSRFEEEIKKKICDYSSITTTLSRDVCYAYSFLCAVELFELYKQDKEAAINALMNIVTRKTDFVDDEIENINSQVTPVKSMAKHLDKIKHVIKQ